MAYPELASRDPLFWLAIAVLFVTAAALVPAWRRQIPQPARTIILAVLVLMLPLSGCYGLLAGGCYVFGGCP